MIVPKPPSSLTFESIYITLIILSCVLGLTLAIIGAVAAQLGSLWKLVRVALALDIVTTRHKKTTDKSHVPTKDVED